MAEAFFNQMAKGRAMAISAGSQPADKANPIVIEVMREAGIDISRKRPKLLTLEMMAGIDKAFTMGCGNSCPVTTVETEDWALEDPQDKPIEQVRRIRDEIKHRVKGLIEQFIPR
jgi:arsenate reductase